MITMTGEFNQINGKNVDEVEFGEEFKADNLNPFEFHSAGDEMRAIKRFELAERYEEQWHHMDESDKMSGDTL